MILKVQNRETLENIGKCWRILETVLKVQDRRNKKWDELLLELTGDEGGGMAKSRQEFSGNSVRTVGF